MKRTLSILACIFLSPWAAYASYDSPEGTVWGPPLTSAPIYHPRSASFRGIRPELAALASTLASACGSRVISGYRHTHVAGTRRWSLHAFGKAIDVAGNPTCVYSHLRSWPGGVSIDYGRVQHVHISYDPESGREMGIRFAHYIPRRYAHRHGRRA